MTDNAELTRGAPGQDAAAVDDVLVKLAQAFRNLDPAGAAPLYADDADWINAFGTSCHGRDAIVSYLAYRFAESRCSDETLVGAPDASIRFVDTDVAIARTRIERHGRRTSDDGTLPVRRNHSLKVLVRREGKWLIASDMYMDALDGHTPGVVVERMGTTTHTNARAAS